MTSSEDNPSQQLNLETEPAKATDADDSEEELEAHRPIVREIDRSLGVTYGGGGGVLMAALIGVVAAVWWLGLLGSVGAWLGVVTFGLIGLFVVRAVVYRRADTLRERLESYCETNGVDPGELREYFGREDFYTFFEALFELQERRRRLARARHDDADGGEEETSEEAGESAGTEFGAEEVDR